MEPAKEIKMYPVSDHAKQNQKTGFVALYRSIKNHWVWKASGKKSKFEAWVDLLLLANHDPNKEPVGYDLIELGRGQILTSQDKLSKEWRWDRSAVRGFLHQLHTDRMIDINVTNKFTIITICNYWIYNDVRPTKRQQNNSDPTAEQHIQPLEPLEPLGSSLPPPTSNKSFKQWTDKDFIDEIAKYKDLYERDMLNNFYKHWSEKTPKGKMKLQLNQTWETKKRLEKWASNEEKFSKTK